MGRLEFYYEMRVVVVVQSEKESRKAKNSNKDLCNCRSRLEQQLEQLKLGLLVDPSTLERSLLKDGDIQW